MDKYKGCLVHSGSRLAELMAQAKKTGKPEDKKAVESHYAEVHARHLKQVGLPFDHVFVPYRAGDETCA